MGEYLVEPAPVSEPHVCRPPGRKMPFRYREITKPHVLVDRGQAGAVWRCDCGQHWHCDKHDCWWQISDRKARRLIRRAARR